MKDCWDCPHKKTIPGDAHIQCGHPIIQHYAIPILAGIQQGQANSLLSDKLGFTFNQHGVNNGWCMFPLNYDPVWLDGSCKIKLVQLSEDNDSTT